MRDFWMNFIAIVLKYFYVMSLGKMLNCRLMENIDDQ